MGQASTDCHLQPYNGDTDAGSVTVNCILFAAVQYVCMKLQSMGLHVDHDGLAQRVQL